MKVATRNRRGFRERVRRGARKLEARLDPYLRRMEETGPVTYRGVRIWREDGWRTSLEPASQFDTLGDAKAFVDAWKQNPKQNTIKDRYPGWVSIGTTATGGGGPDFIDTLSHELYLAKIPFAFIQWKPGRARVLIHPDHVGKAKAVLARRRAAGKPNPFLDSFIEGIGTGTGMGIAAGVAAPYVIKHVFGGQQRAPVKNPGESRYWPIVKTYADTARGQQRAMHDEKVLRQAGLEAEWETYGAAGSVIRGYRLRSPDKAAAEAILRKRGSRWAY